ncbi:uncharacterized protein METZ01_LOCUS7563, partial [marine metagenome]
VFLTKGTLQSINAISIQLNKLMVILYFLTTLITLNVPSGPPTGWIQYTDAYKSKSECLKKMHLMEDQMRIEIKVTFKNNLVSVGKFECTTREDVVKRNTALGH